MEHRYGTRYRVDLGVHLHAYRQTLSAVGRLREVSVSGGVVTTTLPVRPLAFISLRVQIAGSTQLEIEGQVVRRTAMGVAIEWTNYAPELVQLFATQGHGPPTDRRGGRADNLPTPRVSASARETAEGTTQSN
jgi:hypothetical protein